MQMPRTEGRKKHKDWHVAKEGGEKGELRLDDSARDTVEACDAPHTFAEACPLLEWIITGQHGPVVAHEAYEAHARQRT